MTDVRLEWTDSRRLTGPNLLLDGAGAVLEVAIAGVEADVVVGAWRRELDRLLEAVGWHPAAVAVRHHDGGASLAFSAPIDALYAATRINEAAWHAAVADLVAPGEAGTVESVADLRAEVSEERDPARLALRDAAARHEVAFLWDDDEVSVGLGAGSRTWPAANLPAPGDVDWVGRHDVPVALVTGTNGKSTTVRMLGAILAADGRAVGTTSTDGIHVAGRLVAEGDWSGPGGGRSVLRNDRVEAAALEVARGGILRRGLPVEEADVAVVTNVAADHLGEYGIATVPELTQAKLVVAKAVRRRGALVVNADNPPLVAAVGAGDANVGAAADAAAGLDAPPAAVAAVAQAAAAEVAWFSRDADAPPMCQRVAAGGRGWTVVDATIVEVTATGHAPIVAVDAIPATYSGSARHNVENALAAVGAARVLGVPPGAIAAALGGFTATVADNPGRANVFDLDGATVIIDFAHNPHGMTAIAAMAEAMPARRRIVLFGQAGDRGDDEIRTLARRVGALGPAHVVATEIPKYLRGREEGEIPGLIREELLADGLAGDAISIAPSPLDGVGAALDLAAAGDLLVLFVLDQREAAVALLAERGAVPREAAAR